MGHRYCLELIVEHLELFQRFDLVKLVNRGLRRRKLKEIGIETAIHQLVFDMVEGVLDAVDIDGDSHVTHGEAKWEEVSDVIKVPVGQHDGSNFLLFIESEGSSKAASVQRKNTINKMSFEPRVAALHIMSA
jgi:hypothetical protein